MNYYRKIQIFFIISVTTILLLVALLVEEKIVENKEYIKLLQKYKNKEQNEQDSRSNKP